MAVTLERTGGRWSLLVAVVGFVGVGGADNLIRTSRWDRKPNSSEDGPQGRHPVTRESQANPELAESL